MPFKNMAAGKERTMLDMERFNAILHEEEYLYYLGRNKKAEKGRDFCRHGLAHFLDVARIAWIINLEEGLGYEKEIIYVTALLHDIGKFMQYEENIPHETASWNLGQKFLEKQEFDPIEIKLIGEGILGHRNKDSQDFARLIYRADKLSRPCFSCKAEKKCNWEPEKKNMNIYY